MWQIFERWPFKRRKHYRSRCPKCRKGYLIHIIDDTHSTPNSLGKDIKECTNPECDYKEVIDIKKP